MVSANLPGEVAIRQAIQLADVMPKEKRLIAVSLAEFLAKPLPPQEMILHPIIPKQGLVMLYAFRGIGKTHTALGLAYAAATGGSFLKYYAERPVKVVYVDGEMPASVMQKRLAMVVTSNAKEPPYDDYLRIITPDLQDEGIPSLSSVEGQQAIEEHLDGVELVVIDNISTLCRGGKENEGESWLPIQQWALKLRRRGIAVLFIHHAGKNDQQRGTSRREDILDTVISLKRPQNYKTNEGARFEVHYEKARGIFGKDAVPFEAKLEVINDRAVWHITDLEDATLNEVLALHKQGLKQREIADEVGISKSTVNRLLMAAKAEGKLDG